MPVPPELQTCCLSPDGIARPGDDVWSAWRDRLVAARAVIGLVGARDPANRPLAVVGRFKTETGPGAIDVEGDVRSVRTA
jgi:hypothetical protein